MMTFNAIDVETANADRASICQIGIVHVQDGVIVDKWQTLVNPEDWFDSWNIDIHGIDEQNVKEAPTLPAIRDELRQRLRGSILVSHTSFDRIAFERAMTKYNLEQLQVTWLDSAAMARRAWPARYGKSGYKLKNIARDMRIEFNHHEAVEDAMAAAIIALNACKVSNTEIDGWLNKVKEKIPGLGLGLIAPIKREGNPEGPLHGETVLFTGKLGLVRREAADMAAKLGCKVVNGPSRNVTMLVVGTQDKLVLNGYDKSSKHRRIEKLINEGLDIQILSEDDFKEIIGLEV